MPPHDKSAVFSSFRERLNVVGLQDRTAAMVVTGNRGQINTPLTERHLNDEDERNSDKWSKA